MTTLRVLAVYAHPDDEIQATGTLARLVHAGAEVTLVSATRGELGEISDPLFATPATLPYVRELELRAAMAQIGLTDVRFLPYRDSGTAGAPENDHPACLHAHPPEAVVAQLVTLIRDLRPHIVFTWDPNGGHPDHVAIQRHTLTAFEQASDPDASPFAGEPWRGKRLYWGAFSMKRFAEMYLEAEALGALPEPIAPAARSRFERAIATSDPPTSLVHDVSDLIVKKRAAAAMHRSQFGVARAKLARIPPELRERFYDGEERFYQVRPVWDHDCSPDVGLEGLLQLRD